MCYLRLPMVEISGELAMVAGPASTGWTTFWSRVLAPARVLLRGHMRAYRTTMVDEVAPALAGPLKVLDVGCDDGTTAELLMAKNPRLQFEGVDVQTLRPCRIPRKLYDGRRLPFADGSFDAVLSIDVLHHTHHIPELLAEMARVSRGLLVIKDHCSDTRLAWWMNAFGDWTTNAPFGIYCAFNFPSVKRWNRYFAQAGLEVVSTRRDLKLGGASVQKLNPLFVLRKKPSPAAG